AFEGEFDGPPGQRLGLAIEHQLGGLGRPVARAGRPPGRIARPALPEPPLRIAADLFLQGIYRHRYLLHAFNSGARCRAPKARNLLCEYDNFSVVNIARPTALGRAYRAAPKPGPRAGSYRFGGIRVVMHASKRRAASAGRTRTLCRDMRTGTGRSRQLL